MPNNIIVVGSGRFVTGTLSPAVVPKEMLTLLSCETLVSPEIVIVNVAVWFKKGLCALFPAIEPLALV